LLEEKLFKPGVEVMQLQSVPTGCPSLSPRSASRGPGEPVPEGLCGGTQTPLPARAPAWPAPGLVAWLKTGRRRSSPKPPGAHPATAAGSV